MRLARVSRNDAATTWRSGSKADPATIIRSLADVERLRDQPWPLLSKRRISVQLDTLDPRQSRYFETRLNQLAAGCGCKSGSAAAVLALTAYIGALLVTTGWPIHWTASNLVWGGMIFLSGAVAGKLLGLIRARIRLIRELDHLWARLEHPAGAAATS